MTPHPSETPADRWGSNVAAARASRTMSGADLARIVGVSAKHVSQIENGRARPSIELQVKIAGALGVDITTLFPRTDNEADLAARCTGGH